MLLIDLEKVNTAEEYKTASKFVFNGHKHDMTLLKESADKSRVVLQKTVGFSAGELCSISLKGLDDNSIRLAC